MTTIQENIRKLVQYGLQTGLITKEDKIYTTNRLLELFCLDELEESDNSIVVNEDELESILSGMMDYAYEHGIMTENSIVYRDLFDTKIMSLLVPRPDQARSFQFLKPNIRMIRKMLRIISISSARIRIISEDIALKKTRSGSPQRNTVILISLSICLNRKKTQRRSPLPKMQNRAVIPNVYYAWKTRDMRDASIIPQDKITGSYR